MTNRTNLSKYIACSRFTIFRLGAELGWRNGLSNGSFPQFDVLMPRPSRLSEGVLGKIPTDKEAQQDHTLKRSTHQGFPDESRRSAAVIAKSRQDEPDTLLSWKSLPFRRLRKCSHQFATPANKSDLLSWSAPADSISRETPRFCESVETFLDFLQ